MNNTINPIKINHLFIKDINNLYEEYILQKNIIYNNLLKLILLQL
jgi:hypothetical protein